MSDPNIPPPKFSEELINPKEKIQQEFIDQLNELEERLKHVLEESPDPADIMAQDKAKWELHDAMNAVWDKMNRKSQRYYNGTLPKDSK